MDQNLIVSEASKISYIVQWVKLCGGGHRSTKVSMVISTDEMVSRLGWMSRWYQTSERQTGRWVSLHRWGNFPAGSRSSSGEPQETAHRLSIAGKQGLQSGLEICHKVCCSSEEPRCSLINPKSSSEEPAAAVLNQTAGQSGRSKWKTECHILYF